jgi:acyl-CoA synthetase (AMP-forming)/AMP-acid ligase II
MLLYVTLEDVLGNAPEGGPPQPVPGIPATVAALYDLGMRHHDRRAAFAHWQDGRREDTPDWRLDRVVIRLALYCRERLELQPGERVAVFGKLGLLWPVAEFAALGFGAVAVGLEAELGDGALAHALAEAAPRIAVATDAESAERLARLRASAGFPEHVIVPQQSPALDPALHRLDQVLDAGGSLDTPERAQNFRLASRSQAPDASALWHFTPGAAGNGSGYIRLTHAQAMKRIAERLRERPAQAGDVAYVEAPRVSLATRLALHAFVGDGHTTAVLGREGGAAEDVPALRPHRLLASAAWLDRSWTEVETASRGPLWRRSLARRGSLRRALALRLGDRARWIETDGSVTSRVETGLRSLGIGLSSDVGD